MKLYTKTGDKGETSLLGNRRVSKSIVRLEVIGCLDEANAYLGKILAKLETYQPKAGSFSKENPEERSNSDSKKETKQIFSFDKQLQDLKSQLVRIQGELFELGADIATPFNASTSLQKSIGRIPAKYTKQLEIEIDKMDEELIPLRNFILPGGHEIASDLQIARSIVRRAERNLVRLQKGAKVNEHTLTYLNRLSDWLFAAARLINHVSKTEEIIWK